MSTTLTELRDAHTALQEALSRATNCEREIDDLLTQAADILADIPSPDAIRTARRNLPQFCWPIASDMSKAIEAQKDALLYDHTPVECVPRHGAFRALTVQGHRYLVAADGLWLEARYPWLHLIWPLANIDEPGDCRPAMRSPLGWTVNHTTPFGVLARKVEIAFGKVPIRHIRSFAARGMISCPKERGAWMSWEHGLEGTEPRLVWSEPADSEGTPGSLTYPRPEHTATLSPCIDLHTHGTAPAFFSATDDADDAHDVKIAIVLGNLDQPIPTIAARLCCLGVFIPVNVSAEQVFGGEA